MLLFVVVAYSFICSFAIISPISVSVALQSSHSSSIEFTIVLLGLVIFDFDPLAYLSASRPEGLGIG